MDRDVFIFSLQRTLAYFDQFSHPLTAEELYYFLWQPPPNLSWTIFLHLLAEAVTAGDCVLVTSYYFLPGRENLSASRQKNFLLVANKLKITRPAIKILGKIPFVRAIFVCNTVAAGWPTAASDIDVFIIVKTGRLWLTRFLVTAVAGLLAARRGKKNIANRLCLSFYITDSNLSLASVRINPPDIYLTYWVHQLLPLYDPNNILSAFHHANQWTKQYIPHAKNETYFLPESMIRHSLFFNWLKNGWEFFLQGKCGLWLEKKFRTLQLARIERHNHQPSPAVVINDTMLKFHESDRRSIYQSVWLAHPYHHR